MPEVDPQPAPVAKSSCPPALILFLAIIGLIALGVGLFYGGYWLAQKQPRAALDQQAEPPVSPAPTEATTHLEEPPMMVEPSEKPAQPEPTIGPSAKEQITQAMAAHHNKPVAETELTLSQLTSTHAMGGVSFSGEMGGGWFLAALHNGEWVIVDDGNGTISCQVIEPFNFPTSMVGECWDEDNQKLMTR